MLLYMVSDQVCKIYNARQVETFFLNEHVETLSFIKFSNDNRKYVYEIMKRIRKKSTNTMDCLNFIELFRIHGILNQSLPWVRNIGSSGSKHNLVLLLSIIIMV